MLPLLLMFARRGIVIMPVVQVVLAALAVILDLLQAVINLCGQLLSEWKRI